MKNIWKIALLVAALMTSCNQPIEEGITPEQNSGNAIEFYTGDANRTTYFKDGLGIHWEEGDEVAIIVRGWYDKEGVKTEDRKRGKYVAASAGESTSFTHSASDNLTWDLVLPNSGKQITEQDVDFFAVHSGNTYTSSTTVYNGIKVYSSPNQKQSIAGDYSHIGNYTVLASNKVTRLAGDTTPVGFEFTNCTSIVELTLKGDAARSIQTVTLTSADAPLAFSDAYLCVEDFTTSPDVVEVPLTIYPTTGDGKTAGVLSNSVSVTLDDYTALSTEGIKLYFTVLPGTHADGDIILSTTDQNGQVTAIDMAAVTFEKNKIYRPAVTLSSWKDAVVIPDAALEITGGNDANQMFGTVNFENGSMFINSRTKVNGHTVDMKTFNIPSKFQYSAENTWQTLSMMNSLHPNLNVSVKSGGKVYILVDGEKSRGYDAHLTGNGWTCETPLKSANATAAQQEGFLAGTWDETFPIFYCTALDGLASIAYFTMYSKQFNAGDTFNLADLVGSVGVQFRGLRLVAKSIEWPVAAAEIQKTSELSDGELHSFEEGVSLGASHTALITATREGLEKSLPAGFVGMKFFTVARGSTSVPNCRVVTAKVTKSGMIYQLVPKNAQTLIKPSGRDVNDGWRVVDYFQLSSVTANPFYISAKWVEAGDTVTTFDYTATVTKTAGALNYYNTGILMGNLTVAEVE